MNDAAAFAGYVKKGGRHMNDAAAFAGYCRERARTYEQHCGLLLRRGEDI